MPGPPPGTSSGWHSARCLPCGWTRAPALPACASLPSCVSLCWRVSALLRAGWPRTRTEQQVEASLSLQGSSRLRGAPHTRLPLRVHPLTPLVAHVAAGAPATEATGTACPFPPHPEPGRRRCRLRGDGHAGAEPALLGVWACYYGDRARLLGGRGDQLSLGPGYEGGRRVRIFGVAQRSAPLWEFLSLSPHGPVCSHTRAEGIGGSRAGWPGLSVLPLWPLGGWGPGTTASVGSDPKMAVPSCLRARVWTGGVGRGEGPGGRDAGGRWRPGLAVSEAWPPGHQASRSECRRRGSGAGPRRPCLQPERRRWMSHPAEPRPGLSALPQRPGNGMGSGSYPGQVAWTQKKKEIRPGWAGRWAETPRLRVPSWSGRPGEPQGGSVGQQVVGSPSTPPQINTIK